MPIYEYRCTSCGHELEKIQKMSDAPLTDCPACDQPALKKLISAAAFRLKGGGWYETDFKQDGKRNLAGESESGKSGAESAAESSSESKSESKSGSSSSESKAEPKSGTKNSGGTDAKKSGSTDKAA